MNSWQQKVFALVKKIPLGKVSTYKILAQAAGSPQAWRAVGQILQANPSHYYSAEKYLLPCHRVVRSDGHLGGYSQGVKKKLQLLTAEGIKVKDNKVINFSERLYRF